MKKKNTMPAIEINDYYEAQQLACECLTDAISKLRRRNRLSNNPQEIRENNEKILQLKAGAALLVAKKSAFDANQHEVNPPSCRQLEALNDFAAMIDTLDVGSQILVAVDAATSGSAMIFSAIHPDQSTKP